MEEITANPEDFIAWLQDLDLKYEQTFKENFVTDFTPLIES